MLIEFSVENYRSFREKQILSLLPDEGKHELQEHLIDGPGELKLLRSAVVYGANASGKSNLMGAMQSLRNLVLLSANNSPGETFNEYTPFLFHQDTAEAPVSFGINFLLKKKRYHYEVSISKSEVLSEALYFYPKGREAKLFSRKMQHFEFGDYLKGQKAVIAELTAPNQLFISKSAINNIKQLIKIFRFFDQDFMTIPFLESWMDTYYTTRIAKELKKASNNESFNQNFKNLLRSFDTGVIDFQIKKNEPALKDNEYEILAKHYIFNNKGEKIGTLEHPFKEESNGTQKLFVLAGLILRALMKGRVIIIDEFERSLHPLITTFILQMFHDPKINTKGAQLIIATHDTNLLSNSELRRDQIWIVEKDQQGVSSLFSLADVSGIRPQIPFEKWYLSGRFGGVPGIEKLNFELNFQHEEEQN
ncbi:MAG: hypothetical protein DHS20C18_46500 [Saprospiraceae bacterium]|nr:MAG: hypothetical protein DHS20C18_46500 [Saprospiraceae bacterium]